MSWWTTVEHPWNTCTHSIDVVTGLVETFFKEYHLEQDIRN